MSKIYKVETISESGLSTILLNSGSIPEKKVEATLNSYSKDGWELEFMVVERRRYLLLWTRETVIITLSKA